MILSEDHKQLTFCNVPTTQDENAEEKMREILQASIEGRLLIRHKESGMLMQLQSEATDKGFDLNFSVHMRAIPGVNRDVHTAAQPGVKPTFGEKLGNFFNWIASIFSEKYAKRVSEFAARVEHYENFQKGVMPVVEDKQFVATEKIVVEDEPKKPERRLEAYDERMVRMCFENMADKNIPAPQNGTLQLNTRDMAVLRTLALGSEDLSFKGRDKKQSDADASIRTNKPAETYPKAMQKFIQNIQVTGSTAGFLSSATKALDGALKSAAEGDYDQLGKLIAVGLKQNSAMLKQQEKLSDEFTIYAEMGAVALKLMGKEPKLAEAVKKHLGPDSKDLHIARAAKNISDLRLDALKHQKQLASAFSMSGDKEGGYTSSNEVVCTICQACCIEMSMKQKQFDLETTEYADPQTVKKINEDMDRSPVLEDFRRDPKRATKILDPSKMAKVYGQAAAAKNNPAQNKENVPSIQNEKKNEMVEKAMT